MPKKDASTRKKKKPDHRDATLVLRLYALRREPVMRQSRSTMMTWLPRSYDDFVAVTQPSHPSNAAFRQVSSYWEMAYGFARHGVVHTDLLIESGTEGLFLYAKIEPYLERFRSEISPTAFQNAGWMTTASDVSKQRYALVQRRIKAMLGAPA